MGFPFLRPCCRCVTMTLRARGKCRCRCGAVSRNSARGRYKQGGPGVSTKWTRRRKFIIGSVLREFRGRASFSQPTEVSRASARARGRYGLTLFVFSRNIFAHLSSLCICIYTFERESANFAVKFPGIRAMLLVFFLQSWLFAPL